MLRKNDKSEMAKDGMTIAFGTDFHGGNLNNMIFNGFFKTPQRQRKRITMATLSFLMDHSELRTKHVQREKKFKKN